MRGRDRILADLESVYREAYERARQDRDEEEMARLDFRYQRDQLLLEALLDVRDSVGREPGPDEADQDESLLDRARALRDLARRRP